MPAAADAAVTRGRANNANMTQSDVQASLRFGVMEGDRVWDAETLTVAAAELDTSDAVSSASASASASLSLYRCR